MAPDPTTSAQDRVRRDKRFGYIVTAVDGDLSVLPKNLTVGTILLEKRGRGPVTAWDFMNMDTGATASAAGRKIGVGYAVNGKIEWVGGTPDEAKP